MAENENKKEGAYASLTGFRRAVPVILIALAIFTTLCFFLQDTGVLGRAISSTVLGLFSYAGYLIPVLLVLHAVLYPQDVKRKRTVSRVIFSVSALITIATFIHTVTYIGADMVFAGGEFYKNGREHVGGGFIGGAVSFVLAKIFGSVGIIIITVLVIALYVTYFFSSGRSALSGALLKVLNAISDFFSSIGEVRKLQKQRNIEKKKSRRIRELREEQESLVDDDFFTADNGMKELTIEDLGIREVRDERTIEKNPTLRERVIHKANTDAAEATVESNKKSFFYGDEIEPRKRVVNMDYSTTDSVHALSASVEDYSYEPKKDDIIYDISDISSDASAEDVFTNNFEAFDLKLNQELMNKPSSKARAAEPEGIAEYTEPITELSEEDIEKARQRADFEMKKRAAIDAQRRYEQARAEMEREKAERERESAYESHKSTATSEPVAESQPYTPNYAASEPVAESQPYTPSYAASEPAAESQPYTPSYAASESVAESQPYTPSYAANEPVAESQPYTPSYAASEPVAESQPYVPEYMINEPAEPEIPYVDELTQQREDNFNSAINDYERERVASFKAYTPPTTEVFTSSPAAREADEENILKISRAILDPTPIEDEIPELTTEPDVDSDNEAERICFEFEADDDDENIPLFTAAPEDDAPSYDEIEIPEDEQSDKVKELRKLFPFLSEDGNGQNTSESESIVAESEGTFSFDDDVSAEENAYKEEIAADEKFADTPPFDFNTPPSPSRPAPAPQPQPKSEPALEYKKPDYSDYQFPPLDLLIKGKVEEDLNQEEEKNLNAEKLVDALLQFNVRISIKGIDRGPRITRYEIVPARGVKVQSVTNLFNDIALNLGAEGIRMEAPIPGKSAIGVEIPNKKPSTVLLRDLVESDEFICAESKTMSCLGKDVTGNPVFADIAKMPHVLVAGATGMGKSVCINSILISILYKAKPDEVKFIMIDPKKVEFNGYNGIPHLLVPVVTDVKQAAGALMWAVEQMEKRYDLMEALEVRKLDAYNDKVRENPELGEPLPKIIIVIDELNDIMLQVRKPAEDLIMSIAQKARAAGIHLIIGTQRPSVDVITGVIKANIPSRISCKVASYNDSKTILEQAGAEKLLNNGDMLYIPAGAPKALRVQGAFVSDGEVASIMKFLKSQAKGDVYDAQALEEINRAAQKCSKGKGGSSDDYDDADGDDGDSVGIFNDQQFLDAVELAVKSGKISTSLIQRKISIGYGKAAKFIDIMEEQGIVSEPNGQRPRDVLITKDEWHEILSRRSLD